MDSKLNATEKLPSLLRECWNKLNSAFMKRLKPLGITPDHYIALRWLHEFENNQITQSKLANLMATDANNISGVVHRMEALDLITRRVNPLDNRQKILLPTSKGKSLFSKGKKIADQLENKVLSCLTSKEKLHFLILLNQLSKTINKENSKEKQ